LLPVNNSHEQSRQVFCRLYKAHIGYAADSSAQQQISSTSQVHNLCKTKVAIIMHKTDTLAKLFGKRKFGGEYG